jgi:enolase
MVKGITESISHNKGGSDKITSFKIISAHIRNILNSHAEFTTEFIIEFDDGSQGIGSSSRGETISIYEDRKSSIDPRTIIDSIKDAHFYGQEIDQDGLDSYLEDNMERFGRNNCFALSLAFHRAAVNSVGIDDSKPGVLPRLCLNILNGGWHAYTNPVLSDFSEIMIVPRQNNIVDTLNEHLLIQMRVREKLLELKKTVINGNQVNVFSTKDNRAPIEFLVEILEDLGLTDKYGLMIDASAGDLKTADGYHFSLTDGSVRTTSQLCEYWKELCESYKIKFLEDPLHEEDFKGWQELTATRPEECKIIGDNLYSSDALRITEGANEKYSNGVIIKPNQAGTVTAVIEAVKTARSYNQVIIASHRSISTESTYICDITNRYKIPYIKIGPLFTDYSSVIRLNELIRLAGVEYV